MEKFVYDAAFFKFFSFSVKEESVKLYSTGPAHVLSLGRVLLSPVGARIRDCLGTLGASSIGLISKGCQWNVLRHDCRIQLIRL